MSRVTIKPAWILASEAGDHFQPQLFRLLRAIHDTGKLTLAAKAIGISYRHGWDLVAKWTSIFGSVLVTMKRGKGAELTALGEKLLWAEQRTEANLFPQLENIASELNVAIRKAQQVATPIVRIHASHGYAIEQVPELMRRHGHAEVDLKYLGSVEALASLSRMTCDMAGFHVPLGDVGRKVWEHYAKWVRPRQQRVIKLVTRTQGIMVRRGNPLKILSLRDLARPGIRFVNRQPGSGTRVLLDGLLQDLAVDPARIQGYDGGEFTHAAVAAFVGSAMADAAFGIEPAARRFNLDFLPIAKERYMLICSTRTLRNPSVSELVTLLKGREFASMIQSVAGYARDDPGEVATLDNVIPWLGRSEKQYSRRSRATGANKPRA